MARARNIKPGFFRNADLVELPFEARLLFIGLWTMADREGRLEDRPKQIKMELFPADNVDCDGVLTSLAAIGMIQRYEVDGKRYIQVVSFTKHQNPHRDERPSTIPAYGSVRINPDEHHASTVQAPCEPDADTVAIVLNPDSLIPDPLTKTSLLPQAPALLTPSGPQLALVEQKPKGLPDCPHLAVLLLWAEVLPSMPQHLPSMWRGARADHLRARWRETAAEKGWSDEAQGLAYLRKLFSYVGQSPFLTGKAHQRDPTKRPFIVELEWLVNPTNWAKTLEGKYHTDQAA